MDRLFLTIALTLMCHIWASPYAGRRADALENEAWNVSDWISAKDAPVVTAVTKANTRSADGSSWFVSSVSNEANVVSARWMITSLGVCDIYVNGKLIGEEILKPGYTHPEKTKRSFTYDVTDAYRKKAGEKNVLSACVTPGWWADMVVSRQGQQGFVGKKCAFRGVLELVFADGSRKLYGTDTQNWKAGIAGPVTHAGIFDGEEYDARELPGFETEDKLDIPEINTEFSGEILPSDGAEIYQRRDLELKPVKAYVWKDIEGEKSGEFGKVVITRDYPSGKNITLLPGETLVVDFGQNCAAVPHFVFKAGEGVTLTCLPGELLNDGNGAESRQMDGPEGSVHRKNLRTYKSFMKLLYTFGASKAYTDYIPRCSFWGYRYLSISADGPVSIKKVGSVPVTSITREMETGRLSIGNELINKLISNTWWGQLSNYLSVPTDCPQRNERLGWMADTQVFAETGTFFADTKRFFHKWLRDVRDSQDEGGSYFGVAPPGLFGFDLNNRRRVGWADAGIIVPWTVWKQFGDVSVIDESWSSMELYMEGLARTKYDHNAFKDENGNFQWADWLSYEPLESCSGRGYYRDENGKRRLRPETVEYWSYLGASYWAIDAAMMRDMAAASGRKEAAEKYSDMAEEARAYIRETFFDVNGRFKTDILNTMQTPALFALKNGIVEADAKMAMIEALKANFASHGNCLQTGFLGTSILMQTLTDNGMADIAYELLFQRRNPSWLYSVDNGATTIWERWDSYTLENGINKNSMNSFNHYAYGAVCQWIWETAAGISADPENPGFRHIIMKPVPDRRLGHLEAEYESVAGTIRSSWKYEGGKWIWKFTVPKGATASVTLPGETESKEYGSGSYTVRKDI